MLFDKQVLWNKRHLWIRTNKLIIFTAAYMVYSSYDIIPELISPQWHIIMYREAWENMFSPR